MGNDRPVTPTLYVTQNLQFLDMASKSTHFFRKVKWELTGLLDQPTNVGENLKFDLNRILLSPAPGFTGLDFGSWGTIFT